MAAASPPEGTQARSPVGGPPSSVTLGRAPAWRPRTAWVSVAVCLAIGVGARLIVRDGGDPRLGVVIALILLSLAQVAVVILFASRQGRPTAADFGLVRPPLARATGLVVAVLVAASVLSVAWTVALALDEDALDITDRLAVEGGTLRALLFLVLVAVATPLGEEFLFRGYFLRALSNWRGAWPAIVTTSVVFAAAHVGWTPTSFLVPILLFGLGFCLLYHWTGSLYPALAMHALLNTLGARTVFEGWQLPVAMVFSLALTLAIARLIARRLGGEAMSG
jgi:membrane protease YdiL (CAAX protease family)